MTYVIFLKEHPFEVGTPSAAFSRLSPPRQSPWPLHRGWLRRRSGRRDKDPRYLQIGRNVRLQGVGLDAEPHYPTRRASQDDRPIPLLVSHQATVALITARHGC